MYTFTIPIPLCVTTFSAATSTSTSRRSQLFRFPTARRLLCASLATPPQPSLRRPASNSVHELSDLPSLLAFIANSHGNSTLLVVEVWSKGCRACIGMRRTYERVAEAHDHLDVKFARICVDDVEDVRKHLGVRAMPLFVFYKDGGRIDHFASASREHLEQSISDNL